MDYFLIYLGIGAAITVVHLWQKRVFHGEHYFDIAATLILSPLLWPLLFYTRHWEFFRRDPPYVREPFIPPSGWLTKRLTGEEEDEIRRFGLNENPNGKYYFQLTPDCELWHFSSGSGAWRNMCGRMGVCVVKDGVVIDSVITGGN